MGYSDRKGLVNSIHLYIAYRRIDVQLTGKEVR